MSDLRVDSISIVYVTSQKAEISLPMIADITKKLSQQIMLSLKVLEHASLSLTL